jgi:hypothetical protein
MLLVRRTQSETTRTAKAACRGGSFCVSYVGKQGGSPMSNAHDVEWIYGGGG